MLRDNQFEPLNSQKEKWYCAQEASGRASIHFGVINLKRTKKFSLLMAGINFVCLAVVWLDHAVLRPGEIHQLKSIIAFHTIAALIYLSLFIGPSKILNIHTSRTNDRFAVWAFSAISILYYLFLSYIPAYHGGLGLIALMILCGLVLAFYQPLLNGLILMAAGLAVYWFAISRVADAASVSTLFINAVAFSGVVFVVSRRYYSLKSRELLKPEQPDRSSVEQLKSIEKTLLSIYRNLLQGVFRIDQNGGLVYANDYMVSFLGFKSTEELKDRWNLTKLVSIEDARKIRSAIQLNGYVRDMDIMYVRQDGSVFWGLMSCAACSDDGNVFYDGIVIDNTERKNNERMLENLSLVASKTDSAVFIIDKEEKIEWVNESFTRMTGFQMEEAVGRKPGILFQGDQTDPQAIRELGERINRCEGFSGELLNYRKDGSELWVHFTLNPILGKKKEIIKYVAVETDITHRKKVEKELIMAKEEAEASMKAKDQFLSMVSHELRTPLNAVIGMTHLLLQEQPREDQLPQLKAINISGQYLLALINDILDFSKIEAGKISIDPIDFNFHELINALEQTFYYNAQEKNIKFCIEIDSEIPCALHGDPVRLNQILVNLIGNAIKFTDEGFVKLKASPLSHDDGTVHLKFTTTDTGIGIPEGKLTAIFEKFEQVEGQGKRGGTGLGLSITKSLVELMGGSIHAESELGKGSEFTFDLYFGVGNENDLEEGASAVHNIIDDFENFQALLVEDNKINQLVAAKFLNQWKVQFDIAEDGREAIRLAGIKNYNIILMDLQMPGIDGISASREIRKKPGYAKVPIIALTAASMEAKERIFMAGMNDILIKPFNPIEFYNTLKKYAGKSGNSLLTLRNETFESIDISEMQKISDGDTQFLLELLKLCVEQFKCLPVQLMEALKDNNLEEARKIIHKINPSIKMLQYYQLEKTTMEFQKLLKNECESAEIEEKANELIAIIGRIEALLMEKAAELNRKSIA